MGGSMYNHVVETIQEAFATEGFSTLRFNFRGVGKSSGMYDEGRGEQEDILAVCRYLTCQGMTGLFLPDIPSVPGSAQKSSPGRISRFPAVCLFRRPLMILGLIGIG